MTLSGRIARFLPWGADPERDMTAVVALDRCRRWGNSRVPSGLRPPASPWNLSEWPWTCHDPQMQEGDHQPAAVLYQALDPRDRGRYFRPRILELPGSLRLVLPPDEAPWVGVSPEEAERFIADPATIELPMPGEMAAPVAEPEAPRRADEPPRRRGPALISEEWAKAELWAVTQIEETTRTQAEIAAAVESRFGLPVNQAWVSKTFAKYYPDPEDRKWINAGRRKRPFGYADPRKLDMGARSCPGHVIRKPVEGTGEDDD